MNEIEERFGNDAWQQRAALQRPPAVMSNGERMANGMTKREAFAMAAMQGIRATMVRGHGDYRDVADMSVAQADALLAALEKKK